MSNNGENYFQPLINSQLLKKYSLKIEDLPDFTKDLSDEDFLKLESWLQNAIENMIVTGGSSVNKSECLAIFTIQHIIEDYIKTEIETEALISKITEENQEEFESLKSKFVDQFPVYDRSKNEIERDKEINQEVIQNLVSYHIVQTNNMLEHSLVIQLDAETKALLRKNKAFQKIKSIVFNSKGIKKIHNVLSDDRSLDEQFKEISNFLPKSKSKIKKQVDRVIDIYREENKLRVAGHGSIELPKFHDLDFENYSIDRKWMTNIVMIAKNIYVWLSQLSRKYQREISTLDQIPDEELKLLKKRGINSIWLIGIWNRSPASRKIKQKMGNPEAIASAYSIYNYNIDKKLGGKKSFENFKNTLKKYQLKIGCDVIPNHTGIYSEWVIEHPDWYISTDNPPYQSYSFTGEDLSDHPQVSIYLEDKYWDKTDAAVVFKYVDHRNNTTRYIYHGNDGTSTPWNDTAQLNYLNKEVRNAMIKQILDVGKDFDIIRFDAAMTLTKQHYQRLWFPEPGSGGDIPSRYRFGMSKEKFDKLMPDEFWSKVVWNINHSDIDTLLVAEAFWLLEGYFVRSLGMHRVYNSAFMHLLRDQENTKFHKMMAETLEFDPRLLQRYVNFMSNPDEETAIGQFGDGDKYFGICTLLVTIPGLPMFGHGQIEGFHEKYGMEFSRDYYNEEPKQYLLERHANEIFPLLHFRYLFSSVDRFRFYEPLDSHSQPVHDIYAYMNGLSSQFVLIMYNNQIERVRAWIKESYPINFKPLDNEKSDIGRTNLLEDLKLNKLNKNSTIIFEELKSKKVFARKVSTIHTHGLYVEINGYQIQIFANFQILKNFNELDPTIINKLENEGVNKQDFFKIVPEYDSVVSLYH